MKVGGKVLAGVFGFVCGGYVGFILGLLAALALGYWSKWAHPEDASAFSVVIVVFITAPSGGMLGAVLGALSITMRPRLFLATFLPLAVLFIGSHVTLNTLEGMDRPRHFVVEVSGSRGAEFVGVASVDGEVQKLRGALPATFEFKGFGLELAFALRSVDETERIAVKVLADGSNLHTAHESRTGVYQQLRSYGYSETFGGTQRSWHQMSPEEVDQLVTEGVMPKR